MLLLLYLTFFQVTYIFRKLADKDLPGPMFIKLKDGDEIRFGQGERKDIEGPLPTLCNLQYTVARALYMSGVADTIMLLKYDADADLPNFFMGPTHFANILMAKLLLNLGRLPSP